jgi:predicted signal transduction protein with EAL and GGDEF domain
MWELRGDWREPFGTRVSTTSYVAPRGGLKRHCPRNQLHGDEFALLFPETNGENARVVGDKLRAALKAAMKGNGRKITFSIGVVTFKNPPISPDYMISQADKVMLSVKKTGKNRVSYLVLDGIDLGFSTER